MSTDRLQHHDEPLGANRQHLSVWDLRPGNGEPPRRLILAAVDAKERVDRDPKRYAFARNDGVDPPAVDESEPEGNLRAFRPHVGFRLELDLSQHIHSHSPMAQRQFVAQMLHEAADAIGKGYVEPLARATGNRDDASWRHAQGDLTTSIVPFTKTKVGEWHFFEEGSADE